MGQVHLQAAVEVEAPQRSQLQSWPPSLAGLQEKGLLVSSRPGFSSAETVTTDGERTSNSGSDTGTPVSHSNIPFQALGTMEHAAWQGCSSMRNSSDDDMEHGSVEEDMKDDQEDMDERLFLGKDGESVQSKQCPRGHWRPAEDDKLRELVSQYGPQNWNLIAEKLQGRSGNGRCNPSDCEPFPLRFEVPSYFLS